MPAATPQLVYSIYSEQQYVQRSRHKLNRSASGELLGITTAWIYLLLPTTLLVRVKQSVRAVCLSDPIAQTCEHGGTLRGNVYSFWIVRWKQQLAHNAQYLFAVYGVLCVQVVGTTSSEGFLVFSSTWPSLSQTETIISHRLSLAQNLSNSQMIQNAARFLCES